MLGLLFVNPTFAQATMSNPALAGTIRVVGTDTMQELISRWIAHYKGTFDEVRKAVYPLTRFVYIYIDRPPNKPLASPIREFLLYVLSLDGQRDVEQEGIFMPLPPGIAAQQRSKLD
jgi:ABC-type phosphate transport system substrate-binding protein